MLPSSRGGARRSDAAGEIISLMTRTVEAKIGVMKTASTFQLFDASTSGK